MSLIAPLRLGFGAGLVGANGFFVAIGGGAAFFTTAAGAGAAFAGGAFFAPGLAATGFAATGAFAGADLALAVLAGAGFFAATTGFFAAGDFFAAGIATPASLIKKAIIYNKKHVTVQRQCFSYFIVDLSQTTWSAAGARNGRLMALLLTDRQSSWRS